MEDGDVLDQVGMAQNGDGGGEALLAVELAVIETRPAPARIGDLERERAETTSHAGGLTCQADSRQGRGLTALLHGLIRPKTTPICRRDACTCKRLQHKAHPPLPRHALYQL